MQNLVIFRENSCIIGEYQTSVNGKVNYRGRLPKGMGISEERAIRDYALQNASQRLAEYVQESQAFEKKYAISFRQFAKGIQKTENEIFEKEDDYLAWKFAVEGLDFWQKKIQQLKDEQ